MKPELEKLARHRFARASEAFAEGEFLLAKKGFIGERRKAGRESLN